MSAGSEVDLVEQEIAPTIATVQVTPEEARKQNDQINAVITEVLVEGKNGDYWKIPGTPTPTLLQPGAETLQRFFGLGRELSDPVLGMIEVGESSYFSAMVKCSITNAAGRILADSIGYCDDSEKGPRGPGTKWNGNRNTIIQMATKRGYVNAIKAATGTSNHFTSDIEDRVAAPPAVATDRMANDDEKRCLVALFAEKGGRTVEEAASWLMGQPQAKQDSRNWVAIQVLGLAQKPTPQSSVDGPKPDPEDVVKTEPELPAEPGVTETVESDAVEVTW